MRAIVCVILCAGAAAAHAAPSHEDLEARAKDVRARVGKGYAVVVEDPFVVIGDAGAKALKKDTSGFMHWTITMLEQEYFTARPDKIIEVYLFRNETTYRRGAKQLFGDDPDTPYGYYSSEHDAIIMNLGPGAGTLSHELVHPYMEANFPGVPAWFNEGLASLYERPSERDGHIVGLPNWRLPELKREIRAKTLPDLATLLSTTDDEFYKADYDAYAFARYLVYYLQEHGELHDFYEAFRADTDDRTGKAALEATLGEDLATFEPKWRAWVLEISE